jgi:hypothetical protein
MTGRLLLWPESPTSLYIPLAIAYSAYHLDIAWPRIPTSLLRLLGIWGVWWLMILAER